VDEEGEESDFDDFIVDDDGLPTAEQIKNPNIVQYY
jgi:hypothetical protein